MNRFLIDDLIACVDAIISIISSIVTTIAAIPLPYSRVVEVFCIIRANLERLVIYALSYDWSPVDNLVRRVAAVVLVVAMVHPVVAAISLVTAPVVLVVCVVDTCSEELIVDLPPIGDAPPGTM